MYKNKTIILGIFVLALLIVIYFFIFKKSDFGATAADVTTFITSLANGVSGYETVPANVSSSNPSGTGKAPAAAKWELAFLPSTNNSTYSNFLFCDPGWYQPTNYTASANSTKLTPAGDKYSNKIPTIIEVDANNILGASKSGADAGSISTSSTLTPIVGWAASTYNIAAASKKYSWSPTCLSAIPNSYIYSGGTATLTTPLTVTDGYSTRICPTPGGSNSGPSSTGPSGTCGEYGAFNAYFEYDYYASAFMNNDTQFWPFTTTAANVALAIPDISNLAGATTFVPQANSTTSSSKNLGTATTSGAVTTYAFSGTTGTISYSEAMGIPANAILNNAVDIPGGYTRTAGTQGETMHSIGNITGINLSNSQRIRRNAIVGVLVAMHSLMEENKNTGMVGPFAGYKTGILLDLKYYYNQYQYSGVAPATNSELDIYLKNTHSFAASQNPSTFTPININSNWDKIGGQVPYPAGTTGGPVPASTGVPSKAATSFYYTANSGNRTSTTPRNNQLNTTTTTAGVTTFNINPNYPTSGIFISNNTRHAIYLTLMARDNWIKNQLFYVNYL